MAQKLFEYVQSNPATIIKQSTVAKDKMYQGLLNENKAIGYNICKSVYAIFTEMKRTAALQLEVDRINNNVMCHKAIHFKSNSFQ